MELASQYVPPTPSLRATSTRSIPIPAWIAVPALTLAPLALLLPASNLTLSTRQHICCGSFPEWESAATFFLKNSAQAAWWGFGLAAWRLSVGLVWLNSHPVGEWKCVKNSGLFADFQLFIYFCMLKSVSMKQFANFLSWFQDYFEDFFQLADARSNGFTLADAYIRV